MLMIKKHIVTTLIGLTAAILILVGTFVLSLMYVNSKYARPSQQAETASSGEQTESIESAKEKVTLQLTILEPNGPAKYGDTVRLNAIVKNASSQKLTYDFNSGCVKPELYFNETHISPSMLCTQALTTVTLKPNEAITTEYTYKLIKNDNASSLTPPYTDGDDQLRIEPGTYSITAKWQGMTSPHTTLILSQ